jgi:mediator of RNA polymerase II transcription subunit 14
MAKETHREDVRLLSFDLQTVEFVYALVSMSEPFYFYLIFWYA